MEGEHQGIQFFQAPEAHGVLEGEPEGNQEGAYGIEPDEYMDTDYEFEETDDDMKEDQAPDTGHIASPVSEVQRDPHVPPVNPSRENRSPEAVIADLRQQLFVMEARAVRAELERDEVIVDMTEMAQLLA